MMGACEKTKMRQPSEAGWSTMVFSNQASCASSINTSWEVYLGGEGWGGVARGAEGWVARGEGQGLRSSSGAVERSRGVHQ
eukprot:scaffold9905_cov117-Isochrysis_galbana.AAC.13